jgi:Protein of unknown function (DUF4054)
MNGTTPPVTFSFEIWIASFPEFSALTPAQGQAYFNDASLICANSASNPINADGNLAALLYWLTSHFAWLKCPKDANGNPAATGQVASQLVGRISNASEGSVSVQTEWEMGGDATAMEKFLTQTKYGAAYWSMTSQYRTAHYLARPTIVQNVPFGVMRGFFGPFGRF